MSLLWMEDKEGTCSSPPILPIAIIIAIAAVHGELHPGTVEAGRQWQRLFTSLTVVVVRGQWLFY